MYQKKSYCVSVCQITLSKVKLVQMHIVAHTMDFLLKLLHFCSKLLFSKITNWQIYLKIPFSVFNCR